MSTRTEQLGPRGSKRGKLLKIWTPEDKMFWAQQGHAIANLNLWISVPSLFLAFAVWQLWSAVAVNLNASDSVSPPTSCSGWPRRRPCPAPRCASSIPSWCRSSAGGAGPRFPLLRC